MYRRVAARLRVKPARALLPPARRRKVVDIGASLEAPAHTTAETKMSGWVITGGNNLWVPTVSTRGTTSAITTQHHRYNTLRFIQLAGRFLVVAVSVWQNHHANGSGDSVVWLPSNRTLCTKWYQFAVPAVPLFRHGSLARLFAVDWFACQTPSSPAMLLLSAAAIWSARVVGRQAQ